jgi:glycine C-acetyltransferase
MCEYLRFNAHSYMFSSGLPPVNAATALAALEVMQEEDLCAQLQDNIRFMRDKLTALGVEVTADPTGIIPILVGEESRTMQVAAQLEQEGIFVNATVFPAVPVGKGMLRISANAAHRQEEVERALEKIVELVNS